MLREGFTTGTAAAAAAKAGIQVLLGGECPAAVDVPLPNGQRLAVPVARCQAEGDAVRAVVVKDGGDDPDATHRAEIHCLVERDPGGAPGAVSVHGGRGVGRVTLPGLPVPPGRPAINPAPRAQIEAAAREALGGNEAPAVHLTIEVPDGEVLARRTMNARLGIVGGISILGTRGTVKPFSHESWTASIEMAMDVARAAGHEAVALATGGRTARLAHESRPDIPALAVVQMADFFAHSLAAASARGFGEIVIACFFGKLCKMAQGAPYTHARSADLDFEALADAARRAGLPQDTSLAVAGANTAAHALETILAAHGDQAAEGLCAVLAGRAMQAARKHAGPGPVLEYRVYSMDGHPLAHLRSQGRSQGDTP